MANRYFKEKPVCLEGGVVKLFSHVITSTSGTVASQNSKGLSVAKTATKTGRYTVTLQDKYMALLAVSVALVGATDAAYTSTKGLAWFLRNVAVDTGPSFDIQFYRTDTAADAEVLDAAEFYVQMTLKNSTAY